MTKQIDHTRTAAAGSNRHRAGNIACIRRAASGELLCDEGEFAPGVSRSEVLNEDIFCGSSEALLSAGLVQPHELPGQPGNGKMMTTFMRDGTRKRKGVMGHHPGARRVVKLGGDRIEIRIAVSDAERERRHARLDDERVAELAQKWLELSLAQLPQTPAAFRAHRCHGIEQLVQSHIDGVAQQSKGGFRFSVNTVTQMRALAQRLVMLAYSGEVEFAQSALDHEMERLRSEACDRGALEPKRAPALRVV